jgi:Tol biopolymer transport system component
MRLRRIQAWFIVALFAAIAIQGAQKSDPAKVAMEAAKKKEFVDGDLNAAIQQYKAIVLKFKSDHAVAANALMHMADCYQKLGNAEAKKIYEQIVRDFKDQKDAVAMATAALGGAGSTLTTRRIPVATRNETVDFSVNNLTSDGQWMGGTDWKNGDLILVSVATGEIKRMVSAATNKPNNCCDLWGETPVVSPDKKQIAYWWFDYADSKGVPDYDGELRIMPNEPGAKPSAKYKNAYPVAWSPDGKSILVNLNVDENNRGEIAWLSVNDGTVRKVKTIEPWRKLARLSLSPDGLFIAYAAPVRQGAPETNIYIMTRDGIQTDLIQGDINDQPVWSSDGSHILFTRNQSGTFGLWSISVRAGKREGLPTLLKAETGNIAALGLTSSGSYFYRRDVAVDQIFVAEMEQAGGKARGPVTESFVGVNPV